LKEAQASAAPGTPILGAARRRWGEELIRVLLFVAAVLSIATTLGIIGSLLFETLNFFSEVPITQFLFGTEWTPLFNDPQFGVLPLVVGSVVITAIGLVLAIPLGLGSALYLSEYATGRVRKTLKPVLELLAGIPTIVFGFFGLITVTPFLQAIGIEVSKLNALVAGILVGFMVLPTIASVAEDAMSAVPQSLREGSFGLGANRLQTSLRVVFPAALSGVVAAVVLGASRAIGETMIVLIVAGAQPNFSINPLQGLETLTAFIASTGTGDVPAGTVGYITIFAVGMLLFVITLILNAISIRFVRKYRQVYE
jgi:phosphate transport system permease protein